MTKFLRASDCRLDEMKKALKSLMSLFTDVLTSGKIAEKSVSDVESALNLFIYAIFDVNFRGKWRVELLTEILTAAVKTPVDKSIPKMHTLELYRKLDIINKITFLIFQTRQITFPGHLITGFLDYVKGESEYNYYAILLYRVNPQLVKNIFTLDIADATPKELYFGISTGYFPYREGMSECYVRLVEMLSEYSKDGRCTADEENTDDSNTAYNTIKYTPTYVLKLLRSDGFISKNNYEALMSMAK